MGVRLILSIWIPLNFLNKAL